MSWSTSGSCMPEEFKEFVETLAPPNIDPSPQVNDQINAARSAAISLYDSGCVGKGEAFTISLSGHANPDHKPSPNYANDMITVSVTQTNEATVTQYKNNLEATRKSQE